MNRSSRTSAMMLPLDPKPCILIWWVAAGLPSLVNILRRDDNRSVVFAVALSISQSAPADDEAVDALKVLSNGLDDGVKLAAIRAVGELERVSAPTIGSLDQSGASARFRTDPETGSRQRRSIDDYSISMTNVISGADDISEGR